jgi:quercetin dioxygenase-like cupin family protein
LDIFRAGSRPSTIGTAEWFTGTVRIDPLFDPVPPGRAAGIAVTFEPGARTHWHSHPIFQALLVVSGRGRVQRWGHPVKEILPGDVVTIAAGEKHWHGASPETAMTHIAIQGHENGRSADWVEPVSDADYRAPPG